MNGSEVFMPSDYFDHLAELSGLTRYRLVVVSLMDSYTRLDIHVLDFEDCLSECRGTVNITQYLSHLKHFHESTFTLPFHWASTMSLGSFEAIIHLNEECRMCYISVAIRPKMSINTTYNLLQPTR